jgi:dTDP-4-amino-4,6-dideoxygalactose transaminase
MALTNDPDLALRMSMARSHGITRDPSRFQTRSEFGDWYYEQQSLGFNYRMTDIHAALGLSQLARLTDYVTRRNERARRYTEGLRGLPLRLPLVQEANHSAFHLFVVRLEGGVDRARHREVYQRLRQKGVGVNVHYIPVHLQPYYRDLGFAEGLCPEAEAHGASAITLPLFPALDDARQDRVMQAVADAVRHG